MDNQILTLEEVARQLCDGLDMNIDNMVKRLETYLISNPMSLKELNEKCWEDSTVIFDAIR